MKNQFKRIASLALTGVALLGMALTAKAGPGVGDQSITITNVVFLSNTTNVLSYAGTNGIAALPWVAEPGVIGMPSTSIPFNAEFQMEVVGSAVLTNNAQLQVVTAREDDLGNFESDPLTTNTFWLSKQGAVSAGANLTNYFSGWFQLPRAASGQCAGVGIYSVGVTGTGGFVTNTTFRVLLKNLYFPN